MADPLGGSHYIEALTAQMERSAEEIIQEVEDIGGMTEAIIAGVCEVVWVCGGGVVVVACACGGGGGGV